MRLVGTRLAVLVVALLSVATTAGAQPGLAGGVRIEAGQECPPGMTEVRPRNCQAPTLPPPSILDYRPRSTLVTIEHRVPKAKFPAVDYHGHPTTQLGSADGLTQLADDLDRIGVRVIVAANNVRG